MLRIVKWTEIPELSCFQRYPAKQNAHWSKSSVPAHLVGKKFPIFSGQWKNWINEINWNLCMKEASPACQSHLQFPDFFLTQWRHFPVHFCKRTLKRKSKDLSFLPKCFGLLLMFLTKWRFLRCFSNDKGFGLSGSAAIF